jgi:PhzF family phenazine biosynthesis protein
MKLPLYHVDAFASEVFKGNPAGVVPLEHWLEGPAMQAIAMENQLPATAFFVAEGDGWRIRWFTPAQELDLCGHATLASALVIMERIDRARTSVPFASPSGPLLVTRVGERLAMELPSRPGRVVEPPPAPIEGLGTSPLEVLLARDHLCGLCE